MIVKIFGEHFKNLRLIVLELKENNCKNPLCFKVVFQVENQN